VRGKGINYDTGARLSSGWTREAFDSATVRREMQVLAGDLHCTAVRISGSDPHRLTIAGEHAADAGLCRGRRRRSQYIRRQGHLCLLAVRARGLDALRLRRCRWLQGGHNAATFREEIRDLHRHGLPVVVTEFGCCTYRGAADRGARGWLIVDRDHEPWRLDGDYERDEGEQATYLRDLLLVFEQEKVDSAFWFTFAGYKYPHQADPRHDLDLASYGVVKLGPDMTWEPKASFHALAAEYGKGSAH
jgi:hypothetical protein